MRKNKVLIINNIYTPYRTYLFDLMSERFGIRGVEFEVFYQFDKELDRHWDINPCSFKHKFRLSSKKVSFNGSSYAFLSINFDLLSLDFNEYDYVIFSPLMSVNNILLSKIVPKEKQIAWIESNLNSTSGTTGIRGLVKKFALSRVKTFLVPGENSISYIESIKDVNGCGFINFPNLIDTSLYKDSDRMQARQSLGLSENERAILLVGEVCERKGSDLLKDIVKNIKGNVKFFVVGTGDLMNELITHFDTKNYKNRISFVGQKTQSETLVYFSACDVFLHLARRDPSPLVCIEAVSSGLGMVVSSQTGNAREVIKNNGFIVDINNVSSVTVKLQEIVDFDDAELLILKRNSKQLSELKFNPSTVIDKFIDEL